jgi:predicted nucleic acid-binding protein
MLEQCLPHVALRTLDAIHLASCDLAGAAPLVSNDRALRQAAKALGIPLGPVPAP